MVADPPGPLTGSWSGARGPRVCTVWPQWLVPWRGHSITAGRGVSAPGLHARFPNPSRPSHVSGNGWCFRRLSGTAPVSEAEAQLMIIHNQQPQLLACRPGGRAAGPHQRLGKARHSQHWAAAEPAKASQPLGKGDSTTTSFGHRWGRDESGRDPRPWEKKKSWRQTFPVDRPP